MKLFKYNKKLNKLNRLNNNNKIIMNKIMKNWNE